MPSLRERRPQETKQPETIRHHTSLEKPFDGLQNEAPCESVQDKGDDESVVHGEVAYGVWLIDELGEVERT